MPTLLAAIEHAKACEQHHQNRTSWLEGASASQVVGLSVMAIAEVFALVMFHKLAYILRRSTLGIRGLEGGGAESATSEVLPPVFRKGGVS